MKCLGILGGMSWESSHLYYRLINEGVKKRLGGLHSADLLLRSVDFEKIETWQSKGDWDSAGDYLADCAVKLKLAGAEGLIIATNTMHKVADKITERSGLPLIHIADGTGRALVAEGVKRVALLGTGFTMEQAFYKDRLAERFGLEVVIPNEADRQTIHNIIYNELCLGLVKEESRKRYIEITEKLHEEGAQAVILGCTEIGMLLTPEVTSVPMVDTTSVHAESAVEWMLSE